MVLSTFFPSDIIKNAGWLFGKFIFRVWQVGRIEKIFLDFISS